MLTINQLQELYSTGTHVFTESHLSNISLPPDTKIWLTDTGLPATPHDIALGIRFFGEATPINIGGQNYLPIAYRFEMTHIIALQEGSGAVYSIYNNQPTYINKDLSSFLAMLYYAKHKNMTAIKQQDPSALENTQSFWRLLIDNDSL
jgi:hypothetical protein